jgi:hypothetical protein
MPTARFQWFRPEHGVFCRGTSSPPNLDGRPRVDGSSLNHDVICPNLVGWHAWWVGDWGPHVSLLWMEYVRFLMTRFTILTPIAAIPVDRWSISSWACCSPRWRWS